MQYLKKSYIFNKLFKYNFNIYYNKLIISMNFKYYIIKIPSIFYFKEVLNNYSFIFLKKFISSKLVNFDFEISAFF